MITMVHGRGIWKYIMPENVAGGPNEVIECIQRTLKAVEMEGGKLPPVLFFQADNCWREAKNTYVLAYFAWLVERGVFVEIISELPPSWTHSQRV
jgi:hypothetical protein